MTEYKGLWKNTFEEIVVKWSIIIYLRILAKNWVLV